VQRRQKGVSDDSLGLYIRARIRGCAAHTAASAAGELPRSFGRPLYDSGDLLEWDRKEIVQYKGEPLCGVQSVEHHHEREPDGVGHQRFVLGIDI
jgi:hypothetical protein